jgi:hypothetical protein
MGLSARWWSARSWWARCWSGVASVVVGAAVVVETVVVGEAVVGAATGGWVVALTVENASVVVVVSAVADTWAVPGPGALVGLLTARRGPVSEVRVETVGAVVSSRGPVVGATDLAAGWAGTVSRPRTGVRRASGGWGLSRVVEATRAARTPVVSPKATSPSLQGHRDVVRCRGRALGRCRGRDVGRDRGRDVGRCHRRGLARCRGRDLVRCRGGGVGIVHGPGSTSSSRATRPTSYERCLVVSRYAVGRIRPKRRIRQVRRDQSTPTVGSLPSHARGRQRQPMPTGSMLTTNSGIRTGVSPTRRPPQQPLGLLLRTYSYRRRPWLAGSGSSQLLSRPAARLACS